MNNYSRHGETNMSQPQIEYEIDYYIHVVNELHQHDEISSVKAASLIEQLVLQTTQRPMYHPLAIYAEVSKLAHWDE